MNDSIETVEDRDQHLHKLSIQILALASGSTAFTEARKMIADINSAIDDDRKFSGYVEDCVLTEQEIGVEQQDMLVAVASVTIELTYLTGAFDAFGL
jgi:hypothetical protein